MSRVVTPSTKTLDTYGARIRSLLIMACTEVAAQFKSILEANGYKSKRKHWDMSDYVKLVKPMRLAEYMASCDRFPDYPHFRPFHGWTPNTAPPWWTAYNKTKHAVGGSETKATLEHAISAVGAAATLILAQFGGAYMNETGTTPFFGLVGFPDWKAHERTYPPPPGEKWSAFPFRF